MNLRQTFSFKENGRVIGEKRQRKKLQCKINYLQKIMDVNVINMESSNLDGAEMKKGCSRKERQARSNKERMPQYWRHNWFAQQSERYITRRENMEPRGKSELCVSSQQHIVKRGTRLYKRKAAKWNNKPMKRRKKRKKKENLST